jgi:hypothetical protein
VIVSVAAISGLDLHDEIVERVGHLDELVRNAARNREDVALAELVRRSALDCIALDLATRDNRRAAADDAHDVDLALVQLRRAGTRAAAGVDLVVGRLEQEAPFANLRSTVAASKKTAPFALPFASAFAPNSASSWSSSADEAPLTPTAPITAPSWRIGIPPWSGTAPARCSAEGRPPEAWSSKSLLGRR